MKIFDLLIPYLISGFIVFICFLVTRFGHSKAHWLGGHPDEKWSYLEMRTLNTGEVLCFIKTQSHYFNYTVILIYGLTMLSVIAVYLLAIKRIWYHGEADRMHDEEVRVMKMKKMGLTFFTIGVCWLFLILAMTFQHIVFDWIFRVFKFGQSLVLLWVACGHDFHKLYR